MTTQQSVAELILDLAANFESNTHKQEEFAGKIASKTKQVIRFSVVFLVLFSLFTAFAIYSLGGVLGNTVADMETMYRNFGTVADEMSLMTKSVTGMQKNVSNINDIATVVSAMRENVQGISRDMELMDREIILFNKDIQLIQGDTHAMSVTFDRVNRSMRGMRYDLGEISTTSKFIPTP